MNMEGQNMPFWFESVVQKKIKVLFWDDGAETDQRVLFEEIKTGFEKMGWTAIIKTDKDEALQSALGEKYDVVVLDLLDENKKPVGLEILKELRKKYSYLPIIIFSVASEMRYVQGAMRGDVSYYLTKPIPSYQSVVRAVEVAIEREKSKRRMIHERYLASVGSLAASVSHYIKNSLWTISSRAQYLMEKNGYDKETYELLETINKRCTEANQVILNLLNFAKRKTKRSDFTEVDIIASLRDVVEMLSYELRQQHIHVRDNIDAKTKVIIKGNEFYLKEAFLNLIKNAIEAMPDGGMLDLNASTQDGTINISIVDTGHGMSQDVLDKLFIPFFSTKRNSMGYGLFETRRIISEHDGTIHIDSKPDKGTEVMIQFPIFAPVEAENV